MEQEGGSIFFADKGRLSGFVYELSKDSYVFLVDWNMKYMLHFTLQFVLWLHL